MKHEFVSKEEWGHDNTEMGEVAEMDASETDAEFVRRELLEDEWAF